MKRFLALACVAMIIASMEAKVVLSESFERTAGQLCLGANTEMGTNTDDWWSYSGSSNYIQVAEGSLSYPGYASTGKGNKSYLWSSGADDFRKFTKEYNSGKVYLAAIVNVDTLKGSSTADYCLALGDGTLSGMYARLYTKSVKENGEWTGFHFGVAKNNESATYVGTTEEVYAPKTSYLVVLEYEFVDGEKNDTARLYVNPTKETTSPTLVCVQSVQSGSGAEQGANAKNDAGKIASVNLRQGSATPKVYIDEIKVATSWEELFADEGGDTPGGDTPEEDDPLIIETEDNLLANSSFEEYSCNAVFGCSFEDWNLPLNTATANSSDKLLGNNSIMMNPTIATTIDQGVLLTDATYAAGTAFTLTLNYKVINMPEGGALTMDCYWEAAAGGDAEAIKAHDAEVLTGALEIGTAWKHKVVTTTKPAKSAYLRVRVSMPKNAKVLFDAWCLVKESAAPDEPFIKVTPLKVTPVSTTIGNTASFETIHIKQGNVTGTTTFELSGYNYDQFSLSPTEMPEGQNEIDLTITYAPTSAGTHTAILNIDNLNHTALYQSVSLSGTCTDPSAKPTLTVTPSELPAFEVLEGKQQKMMVTLSSANCTDYVHAQVDHIQGAAFTVDGTMFSKNTEVTVTITFAPKEAGTYQSSLTFYSENAESVVVMLNGTGIAKTPETIDWQTDFVWNDANPLTLLNEPFDDITHGETFVKAGWQNVAALDQRPWQGVDASTMESITGEGKFVRASAYEYGKDSTATWETWLVTPALDYKNAASKIFAFSVMGMYLPEDGNSSTRFEVYYIDATGEKVFFQDLTANFDIPTTDDENETWRTFYLDLAPYAETMADVFHIAFRYTGPNGAPGIVTYYVDNVSWGRTDLPTINVSPATIIDSAIVNVKTEIATLTITTSNVEGAITLSLSGNNYDRFSLSKTSLAAEGGEVVVSFEGQEIGVHEAYVVISAKGAPDKYVPMAIKCKEGTTDIENIPSSVTGCQKILFDGQIYLMYEGRMYDVRGTRVEK